MESQQDNPSIDHRSLNNLYRHLVALLRLVESLMVQQGLLKPEKRRLRDPGGLDKPA